LPSPQKKNRATWFRILLGCRTQVANPQAVPDINILRAEEIRVTP
jgi:hypothetical protein